MSNHQPWITRGFEDFRRGTFGNAGQNLYVSRAGVLQRIHLFDLNRDGWFDLLLCNSQAHWERPPTYVYHPRKDLSQPMVRRELVAEGAVTGCVADLNGDGYADLVLGMTNNGITRHLNAMIYYGDPRGWSEDRQSRVPASSCASIAAGDFNGDGRVDLAFNTSGKLRLFYQNDLGGYDALRPVDLPIEVGQLDAADLDGDGFADLYVLREGAPPRIYWGGPDGLKADRFTDVPVAAAAGAVAEKAAVSAEEASIAIAPLAKIVTWNGVRHLFVPSSDAALLLPCEGRGFGKAIALPCRAPLSIAVGRVTGGKREDVVIAAHHESWLFVEGDSARRIPLPGKRVVDVAVGDLDGDGYDDIVLAVHWDGETFSADSLIYRGRPGGVHERPVPLPGEGVRRVFIARSCDDKLPQVTLVNQVARNAVGRVHPTIYHGSPAGFDPTRRTELAGLGAVNGVGCDLNDDGNPDLVIANCAENATHLDPGSYVFLGTNNNFREQPDQVLPTKSAMALIVGDIDRDGYLDAIFSSFAEPRLRIFRGTANGFDTRNPQFIETIDGNKTYTEARRMCLADLNNDGYLDLVLTFMQDDRAFVLWGGPDGFNWKNKQALGIVRPSTPMVCDLRGTGYLDLIIGGHKRSSMGPHDSFVYIYWNGPDGLREDRRTLLPANAVLGMALADFNNDGAMDLYVGNYSDGRYRDLDSQIYWGSKRKDEAYFSENRVTHVRTHSAAGCLVADFNEDGYVDLAIANHKTHGDHKGVSWVVWNGPKGLDFNHPTELPSFGPHGLMHTPPGNQADRGDEEHYVSQPYQMPQGARVARVEWEGELGPKTWVTAQVRTAATRDGLAAAPWQPHPTDACASASAPGGGRWLQYRLSLGATNSGSTPRIKSVTVHFKDAANE